MTHSYDYRSVIENIVDETFYKMFPQKKLLKRKKVDKLPLPYLKLDSFFVNLI